jgi:DNA-binding transcriptional regulator LsrR (DeoR family)
MDKRREHVEAVQKDRGGLDEHIVADILRLAHWNPSQIAELMDQLYQAEMTRNEPRNLIRQAREAGWIRFVTPKHNAKSEALRKLFSCLTRVDVTFRSSVEDVASRAAAVLFEMVKEQATKGERQTVHLGFSGGYTVKKVFKEFANLLSEPSISLPKELVCHALVAGFDSKVPGADPTSFFTYLEDLDVAPSKKFVLLHAPPIVTPQDRQQLLTGSPGIREAYREAENGLALDIIVTSAADDHAVSDRYHSQLLAYCSDYSPETLKILVEDDGDFVGDMLWMPLARRGPIDTSGHPYRAMTLVELDAFPDLIRRGKRVLLVVGPCAAPPGCRRTKTKVLEAILGFDKQLITHLVVDGRTAEELMQGHSHPGLVDGRPARPADQEGQP